MRDILQNSAQKHPMTLSAPHKNLKYYKYSDEELAKKVADYISDNKIVGLHRGKTELGPRALCHNRGLSIGRVTNMFKSYILKNEQQTCLMTGLLSNRALILRESVKL